MQIPADNAVASFCQLLMNNQFVNCHQVRRWLLWLPLRDMLSALVWVAAGVGRHITWRGVRYIVEPDGRMHPVAPPVARPAEEGHVWRM